MSTTKTSTKRDFSTSVLNDSNLSDDANGAKRIRTGGLNTVETDKNAKPENSADKNANPENSAAGISEDADTNPLHELSITSDYDTETNAPRITPEEFMDIVFYDDEPDSDDEDFEDDKEKAQTLCDKFFQLRDAFDNRTVTESGYESFSGCTWLEDGEETHIFFDMVTDNIFYTGSVDLRILSTLASWPHGGLVLEKSDKLDVENSEDLEETFLTALHRETFDRTSGQFMCDDAQHYYTDDIVPNYVTLNSNELAMALVSVPRFNPGADPCFPQAMTSPFEKLPESFRALPDIVLRAAQEHWDALSFAVDDLKTEDFCRRCVEYHWQAIIHVPRDIQTEAFLMPLVQQSPRIYMHISPQLQNVRAIVFAAVSNKGSLLECVPYKLRMDYEINLAAVSNDGMAICHISPTFREHRFHTEQVTLTTPWYGVVDEALLVTAVTQNPDALKYITETNFQWLGGNNYQDNQFSRGRYRLNIWNSCRMRIVAAAANACRLKWGDSNLKSIFLRYLPRYERESDLFLSGLLHLCPFVDLAFEGRIDSEVADRARHFRWMYALVDLDPQRWPTIGTLPLPISEEQLQAMYEGHPLNHSLQRELEQELEESPAKRQRMSPSE